jgi:hypothetical protein
MSFNAGSVKIGPGTIYAANLGTTEPTSVTGAWPSGWVPLGYTDSGSQFSTAPATDNVEVEELLIPIKIVTTGVVTTFAFSLAEATARNYLLALNAGLGTAGTGTGLVQNTTGTNPDGSIWVEPPALGNEVRIMLGWDATPLGAATGSDQFGRLIVRQAFQTGTVTEAHQKGNNKLTYAVTFSLEQPNTGLNPFRKIYPASLAA